MPYGAVRGDGPFSAHLPSSASPRFRVDGKCDTVMARMSLEPFNIIKVESARVVELSLPLSLDSGEFDIINQTLLEEIDREPHAWWVLDLSQLSYMGSAALGLLVNIRQQIKRGDGKLVLCGLSPRLLQIFRTCCLVRLFIIKSNRQDALRSLGVP